MSSSRQLDAPPSLPLGHSMRLLKPRSRLDGRVDPLSGRVEPPTSLLARLSSFLPQLQAANDALLSRVSAEGAEAVDIEHVEDESRGYIEMNVLIAERAPGSSSGSEDDDDGDGGATGTGDSSGGEEDAGGEEEGFAVGLGAAGRAGLRLPPSLQGGCAPAAKRSRKALIEVVAEAEGREGEAAEAGGAGGEPEGKEAR